MFEKNVIQKQLQDGVIVPQGGIDGVVWSTREGLKVELDFDHLADNIAYDSISEAVLFFWDYDNARPIWTQKVDVIGQTIHWTYDPSLWRMMNLLKIESVRVGIVFFMNSDLQCRYIRNRFLMDNENAPENKYVIGALDRKNKTILSAAWSGNGFLMLKLRSDHSFTKQYYQAEVSGYRYENGHFIFYIEFPLMEGEINLSFGGDFDNKIKESGESIFIIDEKENTSISRIVKIDFDAVKICSIDMEELSMMPVVIIDHHSFPFIAPETVIDDEIYELSTDYKASIRRNEEGYLKIICATEIYDVLLSVVTAVYNTAPFLSEMIESVLSQKVNKLNDYIKDKMYKNVFEFILVDDGSTDGSAEILDNYAAMFDCIKVIHKENGGVSSARNAGLDVARGKYVNFADSDDKLSENFFEECILFYEKYQDKIDMLTTPMKFFDAKTGDHWTNYKFKNNNRIIDLEKEPDAISVFTCSSLYLRERICQKFDVSLTNGEDIVFNYEIMINGSAKIGAVSSCQYLYRRRSEGTQSAIQISENDARTYLDYLNNVLEKLIIDGIDKEGKVPKYIQYNVMGQLQWRFTTNDKGENGKKLLGKKLYEEYKRKAYDLLKYIDDDVIMRQKNFFREHKYFLMKKKYNEFPEQVFENDDITFYLKGNDLGSESKCYVLFEFMDIKANYIYLEGYSMSFEKENKFCIFLNDEEISYTSNEKRDLNGYVFDEIAFWGTHFIVKVPLKDDVDRYYLSFFEKVNYKLTQKKEIRYMHKTFPLSSSYRNSYIMNESWVLRQEKSSFVIYNRRNVDDNINFEIEFLTEVEKSKNIVSLKNILTLRKDALVHLAWKGKKKIWLISDNVYAAGDNGEALFRYIAEHRNENIEAYFVINKESLAFEELQKVGKVLVRGSYKHYLIHLISDYIISSAANDFDINPWSSSYYEAEVVRDLLSHSKFVFLQHGITKDDVSNWLNKYNKGISGFVCAAKREAKSILDYNYYYEPENIWLTGFPRHDRLYCDEKNYISIMPTWRKNLSEGPLNILKNNFEESDFYKFYNHLINDKRLLDAAEQYGYQICFMPHPSMRNSGALEKFQHNQKVKFWSFEKSYREAFAESNLIITDYSSSVMDFALLRKPVVYCQFDKKEFFEQHTYQQGYFDYELDGFGEVTYDAESLIDTVIDYMSKGCKVHEPYGTRMDTFFAFHDENNCQRVFEKINQFE